MTTPIEPDQTPKQRLDRQIRFLLEIDKLKSISRQNFLADSSRREDSAEHSWHLAVYVLILAEYFPGVDIARAIKMTLLHDVVEIDAGDTFAYDEVAYLDKDEREQAAARRIFDLLPPDQAAEMRGLWEEFEAIETPAALCAAVVDRIQPLALNHASQGRMWQEHGVTADQVRKRNKVTFERGPAQLAAYVDEVIAEATRLGNFSRSGAPATEREKQQ